MAEAVLRDIVEQIVQETDAASSPKDISVGNDAALKQVESNENKTVGSENEETKEVIRKEKPDLDEVDYIHTETDKEVESESDPSDDAATDDNNNDFLTTEDEAEDFLKHVLRDNNDSDQDDGKAKTGFELSSDGCGCIGETLTETEERLNIAAALINFGDIQNDQAKPIDALEQTSDKALSVDHNKCLKQPVNQESPYFSNTTDIDIDNVNKNDVPIVDTCSLLGIDMTVGDTKSSSNSNKTSSVSDINNNNNLFDDTNMFKYDWSKCFSSYNVSDNRCLSTPDAEMDNISPDLSCMMQLSPTATYGKDHVIGCQRLYSRQNLQGVSCSSTLNTPDPVLYEDTDSNGSNMGVFRKLGTCMSENTLATWPDVDVNNNADGLGKGTKRKHSDLGDTDGPSNILSDSVVTSLMNQGRPPDISTWRAVNSSFETQGNFVNDDLNGQWNKPTCTVQPFQTTGQFNSSVVNGLNLFGGNQPALYRARAYNPYDLSTNASMNQLQYNQYNSNALLRPSCQYTSNQVMNASNYRPQLFNNGLQNTAAYRLDFSSPVNEGTPGVLNFVSNPQYLGVDLSRPRAVHANNLQNIGYNTGLGYSTMPNRPVLNSGGFRHFYQSHSQADQQVHVQIPYISPINQNLTASRIPCATQTFTESIVDNSQANTMGNASNVSDENASDLSSSSVNNNNNKKLDVEVSGKTEKVGPVIPGCEECDNISDGSDQEFAENTISSDIGNRSHFKSNAVEVAENCPPQAENTLVKQGKALDKSIQSNEADSTTIDLTCNSLDEDEITSDLGDPVSPSPVNSFPKIQSKYFSEIYMRKKRCNSPITSFCTALDLSKREQKKDIKKAAKPLTTVPQNIRPYCEPPIPVSAVLNAVQAPTLAYSGAMLVPYMNSIFAAMASMNKTQTSSYSSVTSNSTDGNLNTSSCQGGQNTTNVSPLTQTNNLTLNQQVLMYSNLLHANQSTLQTSASTDSNALSQSTISSMAGNAPTLNVNSIPLPLYAAPIQYPIRPLLPVMNNQGLVNPCLYRFNFGVPIDTAAGTNSPISNSSDINNNNTASSTFSNTYMNTIPTSTCSNSVSKPVTTDAKPRKLNKSNSSQRGKSHRQSGQVPGMRKSASMPETKTAGVPMGRSISAVDRLDMSIQGSTYTSAKPAKSRRLITYQPVPDRKMFQSVADRKKRVFKAKHFPLTRLEIGDYKYSCGSSCSDRVARVKFLFSKKLMVYEFQLENPDGSAGVCKDMVEISVPFWSIISLWLYERDMRVEVKEAPKICLGKKGPEKNMNQKFNNATVYNRKLNMDITKGELFNSPYHYVQFKNNCADRLKAELKDFDNRFEIMFCLPLIEDTGKSLKSGTNQITSHLLDPSICLPTEDINNNNTGAVYQPDKNVEVSVIVSCSCTNGCSAGTCQCCVKGTTCTEGLCECVNCRNPLNILHQLGLTADRARTDPCLMENIYQIKRLDCYVKTQLVLECCHIPVLLFSCIPGEIKCANHNCTARYKYSWCTARLLNEDITPRNHCVKCAKCTDSRNKHCQRCKICYFAGDSLTLKCPVCQSRQNETQEVDSSTESDD